VREGRGQLRVTSKRRLIRHDLVMAATGRGYNTMGSGIEAADSALGWDGHHGDEFQGPQSDVHPMRWAMWRIVSTWTRSPHEEGRPHSPETGSTTSRRRWTTHSYRPRVSQPEIGTVGLSDGKSARVLWDESTINKIKLQAAPSCQRQRREDW